MRNRRRYTRDQSPLYKITSPGKLAECLGIPIKELRALERAEDNYIRWLEKKSGREIQQPKPHLRKIHVRVADLLSRIDTPDFLYSAVKGRSYIDNAQKHQAHEPTVKLDIRKFFPSVRVQAVFHFFRDRMLCAGDVAGLLAQLLTVDGHLATGSNVSPILSYFTYEDMFCEMHALALSNCCMMTCYVDDMVFTGVGATRRLIYDGLQILRRYRLWGHKTKIFRSGKPKVVTGVAVTSDGSKVPNRRQKYIREESRLLARTRNVGEKLSVARRLTGRLYEAAQIDSSWQQSAKRMARKLREIERKVASKDT